MGQMGFNGVVAGQSGQMHEDTFNVYLARALRQRRKVWRDDEDAVQCERLRTLIGDRASRPDIVVQSPDSYPVVVETEWNNPADADAISRIGKVLLRNMLPIRSAVSVGVPAEVRNWSDHEIERRLSLAGGIDLRFACHMSEVSGFDESESAVRPVRWPSEGWVVGDVADLAELVEDAAAPPALLERTTLRVAEQITGFAGALSDALDKDAANEIAHQLGQQSSGQALRLACCIWMTSWRLHYYLARVRGLRDLGLKPISELRSHPDAPVTLSEVRRAWNLILNYNYKSIFLPALAALHPRLPELNGAEVLDGLARLAEEVISLRLGNSIDFAGELFPRLLDDRGETAAHYTKSASAEMLVAMVTNRITGIDWESLDSVSSLRVADMACGTGTLLRTTYGRIRRLHDSTGAGEFPTLHKRMMVGGLTGLDINALASHMTAAAVSSFDMATPYESSNIGSVGVSGGKTGSLELLDQQEVVDVVGEAVSTSEHLAMNGGFLSVPDGSQHVVIQNPPYTRAQGGRSVFALAGMSERQRELSRKALARKVSKLRAEGNMFINGHAGFGTHFSALADLKLRDGGVFASVLPLTAAHADTWGGFREEMMARYENVTAVAFVSDLPSSISADTDIGEILVVATKRESDSDAEPATSITCVNLDEYPDTIVEAKHVAKAVDSALDQGRGGTISMAGRPIGAWTRINMLQPRFPWFPLGTRNTALACTLASLFAGEFRFDPDNLRLQFPIPMSSLSSVLRVGDSQDAIGHLRTSEVSHAEGRGVFAFDSAEGKTAFTYPSMWSANANTQRKLKVRPTHDGDPEGRQGDRFARLLEAKSNLVIATNYRQTSQALAAAWVIPSSLGGRQWTTLIHDDLAVKQALAIWLNSTFGLMTRVGYAQTTQRGRSAMQQGAVRDFPVPDFADAGAAGQHARATAELEFARLSELDLMPGSLAWMDTARREFDKVVLAMLGMTELAATDALDNVRNLWCREPSVHGGNRKVLRSLGIPQ